MLREDVENLRARIAGALAVHINVKNVGPYRLPQPGTDYNMLDAPPYTSLGWRTLSTARSRSRDADAAGQCTQDRTR